MTLPLLWLPLWALAGAVALMPPGWALVALLGAGVALDVVLAVLEHAAPARPYRTTWTDVAWHVAEPARWVPWLLAASVPRGSWWPALPGPVAVLAVVLAFDAERYLLHRACHAWRPLWWLHGVHHALPTVHVLTGRRVHPMDPTGWGLAPMLCVAAWCSPSIAAAAGVVLLGTRVQHAEVDLPAGWWGRVWMHRGHHVEHHRDGGQAVNLGAWLTVWDRVGGTYR